MQMTWDFIAGFTDGEGHIGIVGRAPRITLGQKTAPVLEAIAAFLSQDGYGPLLRPRKNGFWTLVLGRRLDVYRACLELQRRTIVKQNQIATVLAWYECNRPRRWWTDLDRADIARLVSEGVTAAEIGRRLSVAHGLVELAARKYAISLPRGGRIVNGTRRSHVPRADREKTRTCRDCPKKIYPGGERCHSCATKLRHRVDEQSFRGSSSRPAAVAASRSEGQAHRSAASRYG